MFDSWIFWIVVLCVALAIGVLLSWIERKSSRKTIIGRPSKYPAELVTALKEYFRTQDSIKSAYLAQISDGSKNELSHPIIGVEVSGGFDRIQEECGEIAKQSLKQDEIVDFLLLGEDEVSMYMKERTEPFYKV
jgi:hypothetical protein